MSKETNTGYNGKVFNAIMLIAHQTASICLLVQVRVIKKNKFHHIYNSLNARAIFVLGANRLNTTYEEHITVSHTISLVCLSRMQFLAKLQSRREYKAL